ncbi:MAG TPA: alpha/beta hydrolase [Halococcus sp.]|nr:alpha/beta hydrolase [Halococcus sp.]
MPTVQTNGIQTYYEEYGEGPPIVFLHGAPGDHRLWAEQARPLASEYRIIVYDLRGNGRTGGSEIPSYTMELYADDLDALIAALDLDRPAICGLSMGGMVAQTYAAKFTENIAALCTLGAETPEILTHGEWFERRILPKLIERLAPIVGGDRLFSALDWIYEQRYGEETIGDLEKAEQIQQAHAEEYPEISETEFEKIEDMLTSYPAMSVDYASITIPSLLMYGERERKVAARHAKYMVSVIPDAEDRQIPNAGHNSHVDNPEFIVETLREFLTTALGC